MPLFKCKMCGGDLEIKEGMSVAECQYCGTQQTLPRLDSDRRANLYDRANHFRRNNEYDKAMSIYEQILNEDSTDAEAYWSLVLCRYGIEYVEDPATHKRVPTVNRAQFTSIFADEDYKQAIAHADGAQRAVYEAEAKAIDDIQKGILEISSKEEPFDVFICYKETDNNGRRTPDSVLANDLYHQLTQEGFKVFFSRITLEDKLGTAYEPYIFAALNSAKVMVVLGTRPEYFNAVWVKNEWSRYLALIKNGAKKILIPAYRDMDPYDLPEEFSHLQAQDMSKLGFMQDLIRGIKKLTETDEPHTVVKETVTVNTASTNIAPLLKRAFMFLEDGDWQSADEYCEKVLDADPECAQAYLGKLMAELQVRRQEKLADCAEPFDKYGNYQKALRFADEQLAGTLNGYINHINERNENQRLTGLYNDAVAAMQSAETEKEFKKAAEAFQIISGFKDADDLTQKCMAAAETARKNTIYNRAKTAAEVETVQSLENARELFNSISGWLDADEQAAACERKIAELKAKEEAERIAEAKRIKRNKKIGAIVASVVVVCIAFMIVLNTMILPSIKYGQATELYNNGKYYQAATMFFDIKNYNDAKEQSFAAWGKIENKKTIAAGDYHTVALKSDGTAVATGNNDHGQCNVLKWTDLVAVSAGNSHTVGLKSDGTVVAVGNNEVGQCNVDDWKDVVAISAGAKHTVGLKADGTVIATGDHDAEQCNVSEWNNIVAIATGAYHTVGLKDDGTVIAAGQNYHKQCNVSDWKDIIAISAGEYHTVGLRADRTAVAIGFNVYNQCDISKWTDVVEIAAGHFLTVGIKADGTVVVAGSNINESKFTDIVAVDVGWDHTVGLKADGTVVADGKNYNGQCDVSGWTDIKVPEKK